MWNRSPSQLRSTPLRGRVGTSLMVLVACLLGAIAASCVGLSDQVTAREVCLLEEADRIFNHDKNTQCGCDNLACPLGSVCFQHDCCNPQIDGLSASSCGCAQECGAEEICVTYDDPRGTTCCDPKESSDRGYCGCTEACLDTEGCLMGTDGVFSCECDPTLAAYWDENCGCTGEVCGGALDCQDGTCRCDVTNDAAKNDSANCGCRGACPNAAYCKNGACTCENETSVICCVGEDAEGCETACIPQTECICDPQNHQGDAFNCNCEGPCPVGEKCQAGACVCDENANLYNPSNCACQGACSPGQICASGTCTCPPENNYNEADCGCAGPCDPGLECIGGSCQCPPANLTDSSNCGCQGPCPGDFICIQGVCECPAWKNTDESDCGCGGPCDPDAECINGVCQCPPANMVNPDNCGCQGPCPLVFGEPDMVCVNGYCGCPDGYFLCEPVDNLADDLPHPEGPTCIQGNLGNICEDCVTVCPAGSMCDPQFDGAGLIVVDIQCN